jgi:hypothetical protein
MNQVMDVDLTTLTRPNGQSVRRLIESIDRHDGLSLREAPLWGSHGEGYGVVFFSALREG